MSDYDEQKVPLLNSKGEKQLENDPAFKGVKEHGRKFNNVIFGIAFWLVFAGFIAVSVVGFRQGNPSVLVPSSEYVVPVANKAEYWFQDSVAQLKNDRFVLLGAVGIALVLATLWITLIKYFTKIFIYLTVIAGIFAVLAVAVYVLALGIKQGNNNYRITSYVLFGLGALLLIIVFFFRSRINLTAALFKETCRGVQFNPAIFLVAAITLVFFVAFTAYWVTQFVYLYSIPENTSVQLDPRLPVKFNQPIRNLMYFQVFAYFWTTSLISAVFQFSVAGAIATWYFSRDVNGFSGNVGSPAIRSFGRALTKSFGSLALGALILAIVQFVNFLVRQSKKYADRNRVTKCLLGCVVCILGCIERIVKFVDRFTYIHMAMHGEGFLTSAKNVFELISRNMFSLVVVDFLGDFVLFVGKLLGTAATTFCTVAILHGTGQTLSPVTLSVVAVGSFVIFHLISHVIGVGVDTVFVCYMEDLERNKEGGLYIDPEVHQLLQSRIKQAKPIVN